MSTCGAGVPLTLLTTSRRMLAPHLALSGSNIRYLGAKQLSLHRRCGFCRHRRHAASRQAIFLEVTGSFHRPLKRLGMSLVIPKSTKLLRQGGLGVRPAGHMLRQKTVRQSLNIKRACKEWTCMAH